MCNFTTTNTPHTIKISLGVSIWTKYKWHWPEVLDWTWSSDGHQVARPPTNITHTVTFTGDAVSWTEPSRNPSMSQNVEWDFDDITTDFDDITTDWSQLSIRLLIVFDCKYLSQPHNVYHNYYNTGLQLHLWITIRMLWHNPLQQITIVVTFMQWYHCLITPILNVVVFTWHHFLSNISYKPK